MADSSMLRILQLILVYNRVYQLPKKKNQIFIYLLKNVHQSHLIYMFYVVKFVEILAFSFF